VALLFAVLSTACGKEAEVADAPPPVTWDTAHVVIHHGADSTRVLVEVSDNDARRSYGLMERHTLDPESGMIFTYASGQPATAEYWMFRTPGATYWSALEVNQGFFARHGIVEGDTLRLAR
jgi:uncharacterized membrane protein (UPF0127 family)